MNEAEMVFRHPVAAAIIFGLTFVLISFRRLSILPIGRPSSALLGAVLMVAFGVTSPKEAYELVNWDTICLLLGMMIVAEHLRSAGLFEKIITKMEVFNRPFALLVIVAFSAALLSAILVNDPVCVVFTPLVLLLCHKKHFNPLPFLIVLATPSFAIKDTVSKIKPYINENTIIVNVAKGFDLQTNKSFSTTIKEVLKEKYYDNLVSLVGPSFAEEVVEHQYTSITAFSTNIEAARIVQKTFSNNYFRVYTNQDVTGAEYCSALKNVIALASGIIDGLGCKVNSRASLISRGLTEISRYVEYFGGNIKTCYGLAGIGDLTLTCSSTTSRNYSAGYTIGKNSIDYFNETNTKTIEGIYACKVAYNLAKENNIYSPIVCAVYDVLYNHASPKEKLIELMKNELKGE